MAVSAFKKGAALGATSVLVLGWLVVVAAAWMLARGDEPPEPTAERLDASGTVTSTEPQLCVEGPTVGDGPTPQIWCGLVQPGFVSSSGIALGDVVVGTIVGVETDPGSGSAFAVWESLSASG